MTIQPPGPVRLFPVAPSISDPVIVRDDTGRHVCEHADVFAAVLAAAATATTTARPVWLIRPDRWHASITPTDLGWHVDGTDTAPLDAIRRVLTTHAQGATHEHH